jgi:hypothetical protein
MYLETVGSLTIRPLSATLPAPVGTETCPVPLDDGVGLDHQDGVAPAAPESGQEHPQGAVPLLQFGTAATAVEDLDLMSQGEVLDDEELTGLNTGDERSQ